MICFIFQGAQKRPVRRWDDSEKAVIDVVLGKYIRLHKAPGKADCEKCIARSNGKLANRTWRDVKNYVHNLNSKQVSVDSKPTSM